MGRSYGGGDLRSAEASNPEPGPEMPGAPETDWAAVALGQVVGLYLLERWDAVCAHHGVDYHLGGGTLLGAVREGRFISWDDDVDVAMPRSEFDRVRALVRDDPALFGSDCAFDDGYGTDGTGRLVLLPSESPRGRLRLDVFTIDDVPDASAVSTPLVALAWVTRIAAALANGSAAPDARRPAGLARGLAALGRLIGADRLLRLHRTVLAIAARLSSGATANCLNGGRPLGKNRPKAWYDGRRSASFEGRQYPVPAQAERVLELRYGPTWRIPRPVAASTHVVRPVVALAGGREWRLD